MGEEDCTNVLIKALSNMIDNFLGAHYLLYALAKSYQSIKKGEGINPTYFDYVGIDNFWSRVYSMFTSLAFSYFVRRASMRL